jgi:protein-S-isoprenylcysteine O-methyltransferase Ste14
MDPDVPTPVPLEDPTPRGLELKVPPAAVVLLAAGAMWGLARAFPDLTEPLPWEWTLGAGVILGALGVVIALSGVVAFRRHGTTVDPLHPEGASRVVDTGPYRFTRNPMYLGMAVALTGWAVALAHPLGALFPPLLIAYLTRFQIRPEERALRAKFGEDYEHLVRRVPRWL